MKTTLMLISFFVCVALPAVAETFDDLYPELSPEIKKQAIAGGGYYNALELQSDNSYAHTIPPPVSANTSLIEQIIKKHPKHLIETLIVLPHPEGRKARVLDLFHAVTDLRKLAGRTYFSFTRQKEVPLFEKATRINNLRDKKAIPDPPQSDTMPAHDEVYSRLTDINFGNCYYISILDITDRFMSYHLTNVEDIWLVVFPVMDKGDINLVFHLEPVDEGILVYALSAIEIAGIGERYVDVPSATRKRFEVVKSWIEDGINGK